MIPNPTPITATFSGMWIQNARIIGQRVDARIVPYDGQAHLLATGAREVRAKQLPEELAAQITAVLQRLADTDQTPRIVHVSAFDPAKPVSVTVMFAGLRPYTIRDAFALAGTDAEFGAVFQTAMLTVAGL